MSETFGMMSGAYFVGRKELLSWLNELLFLSYTKVEQCASGAAHLQIMDVIHPGKVPLSKVNFNATQTYEFVENFKILQKVFKSVGLERQIDVPSLIKAKYQDNLEFLQWIKCYFENCGGPSIEYDANAKRKEAGVSVSVKCGGRGSSGQVVTPPSKPSSRDRSISTPNVRQTTPTGTSTSSSRTISSTPSIHKPTTTTTSTKPTTTTNTSTRTTTSRSSVSTSRPSVTTTSTTTSSRIPNSRSTISTSIPKTSTKTSNITEEKLKEKEEKISKLSNQLKELNLIVEALGKERDFYFNRLRNVEIFCQTYPESGNDIIHDIEKILYSTEENTLKVDFHDQPENNDDDTF